MRLPNLLATFDVAAANVKVYVAGGLNNVARVREVMLALQGAGGTITYDWTVHGSVRDRSTEEIGKVAAAELQGVAESDFVVVVLPGGYGTHTEMGAALALSKPVFVISDGRPRNELAFYNHPLVTWVEP